MSFSKRPMLFSQITGQDPRSPFLSSASDIRPPLPGRSFPFSNPRGAAFDGPTSLPLAMGSRISSSLSSLFYVPFPFHNLANPKISFSRPGGHPFQSFHPLPQLTNDQVTPLPKPLSFANAYPFFPARIFFSYQSADSYPHRCTGPPFSGFSTPPPMLQCP